MRRIDFEFQRGEAANLEIGSARAPRMGRSDADALLEAEYRISA